MARKAEPEAEQVTADVGTRAGIRVLLIDDEAGSLLPSLAQNLGSLGFEFVKEVLPQNAVQSVSSNQPDIILLDMHFPGDDRRTDGRTTGGEILTTLRRKFSEIPVVVFTTRLEDNDIPLECFEEEPHGYFAKPDFHQKEWASVLSDTLRRAIETAQLIEDPEAAGLDFFVGKTQRMHEVAAKACVAARNSLNVLIYGETGTGKQRLAESIHKLSGRKGRFEHLNCSGMDESTMEARLFGHEKGAFTGAHTARPGLFNLADGGTLFLDEIQAMPMDLQNKLMLVIENGKIRPMGASTDRLVDVRIIVATNHSLSALVEDGLLRSDLAERFKVILIALPPLRDRMEDLPALFGIFLEAANRSCSRTLQNVLRSETLEKLKSYRWPGNIRELENTIMRAVVNTTSNILLPQDIQFDVIAPDEVMSLPSLPGNSEGGAHPAAATPSEVPVVSARARLASELTDQLEVLDIKDRYAFLLAQGDDLRKDILTEIVRRLRQKSGKKVRHKELACVLDPLINGNKDFDRIRQFINGCVRLSQLACNQYEG